MVVEEQEGVLRVTISTTLVVEIVNQKDSEE